MFNEVEFNDIVYHVIVTLQKSCKLTITKKSFFVVKNNFSIESSSINICLTNRINYDIYISLNEKLKKELIEKNKNKIDQTKISLSDEQQIFKTICNEFIINLKNSLNNTEKKSQLKISCINYIEKLDEIIYETILVLQLSTEICDFFLIFGFNKLKYEQTIPLIFYGFTKELMEELSSILIPKGIEIFNIKDEEEFNKFIDINKFNIIIIDYCLIHKSLSYFLDNYFYKIPFKANLIFGISKSDISAFKSVPVSTNKYQIIGLFLRSFSPSQIAEYLFSVINKTGIKINERRKNIRIKIQDFNRAFAFIIEKGIGISSKIIDLSMNGFKGQLDNLVFFQRLSPNKELKLVNIYIKSFHITVSCKVVYINEPYFAVEFTYISDKDKDNLSRAIFNLLQENKYFLLEN